MRRFSRFGLLLSAALASLSPLLALGSGFALQEQSGSRLGTAFAGSAAAADDVTTLYFNPAGLIHLDGDSVAFSVSGISISSEFSNSASAAALGQTLGNTGGDAGGMNWVPSAYWGASFDNRFAVGVGVNAPFGLKLEYDGDWLGRFQARRSEIKTLNINPAFALRVNDFVTLAVGVDYQKLQAELTSAVNYTAAIAQVFQQRLVAGEISQPTFSGLLAANAGLQGHTVVSGEDWAWGGNVGVLFDITPDARIGFAYRSPITYHVDGDVRFFAPTAIEPNGAAVIANASTTGGPLASGPATVTLKVPASATASYWQRVARRIELLADVAWTEWSTVPELRVLRGSGTTLSVTPENWRDTWRGALGAAFAVNPTWKLRAGVAYDQTPVPDATRTPRLPDADRIWAAVGAQWAPTSAVSLDFGYAHLFSSDVPLNQNAGSTATYGLVNGSQSNAVDIFSAQVSYKF